MSVVSRIALNPLAISLAVEIEAVIPPIAVQSIFLSAFPGDGCVGASSISRGTAGTFCGHQRGHVFVQGVVHV